MWGSAAQMRQLLVTIVLFCSVCDAASLFNEFYEYFTDDILYNIKKMVQLPTYNVPEDHLKNYVLLELDSLFVKNGGLMTDHGLPEPDRTVRSKVTNRLLAEELAYDCEDLVRIHGTLVGELNIEQKMFMMLSHSPSMGSQASVFLCMDAVAPARHSFGMQLFCACDPRGLLSSLWPHLELLPYYYLEAVLPIPGLKFL